jgi:protein translocase SEC61 complex gamma subunit
MIKHNFVEQCKRTFAVTKKPSKQEFRKILQVTAIGMISIGTIGFTVTMIWLMTT